MPGFIKDINGSKRMRFVKPGHDPNNLNLDPNLVIFDSDTIGNLSVLDYGEDVAVSSSGDPSSPPVTTPFRRWNLGYAPLVTAQIKYDSDTEAQPWGHCMQSTAMQMGYLSSSPSGLSFTMVARGFAAYRVRVRWTAYRFPI